MQTAATTTGRSRVDAYLRDYESMWSIFDTLLARVTRQQWSRRYGKDWTYADVPFHISYFERIIVADAVEHGRDLPAEKRPVFNTMGELNAWNDAEFARRPAGQTAEESIAQMNEQRVRIRALLGAMSDADLTRPAWSPFFDMGWLTAEDCLAGGRLHLFSEAWELRQRLGARDVELPEHIVHAGLSTYLRMMGMMADPAAAEKVRDIAAVWQIEGRGGGTWTVRLRDARASVEEGRDAAADVVVRTSVDSWMAVFKKTANPMLLLLTGRMRVSGMRRFGAFGRVFKEPALDRRLSAQGNKDFFLG